MVEWLTIRTASSTEVVKIASVGPQGPKGDKGDPGDVASLPLSTQGDLLYRGASENQRLGIGSSGQVLKVSGGLPAWANESGAVTSVNGESGAVVLNGFDIDTSGNDDLAAFVTYDFADGNGIYYPLPDSTLNSKRVYRTTTGHHVFFQSLRWHITDGSPNTQNIIESSDDDNAAWPWLSAWDGSIEKAQLSTVVGRARSTFLFVGDSIPNSSVSGLSSVAASGAYADLSGKPTLGTASTKDAPATGNASSTQVVLGNDTRLSDARTPSSTLAHAASHFTAGSDPLAPSDIGAQGIFAYESVTITANTTLTAARAKIYDFSATSGTPFDVTLPTTGNQAGDIIVARSGFISSSSALTFKLQNGAVRGELGLVGNRIYRWVNQDGGANGWLQEGVALHQQNLADPSAVSGILPVFNLPTGTTSSHVAAGDHTHGNLTNDGKVGSTSGLPLKTGTAGVVEAGAFGTSAGTFCEGNDARLSNSRTPTSHTHAASDITSGLAASATTDTTNASNISSGTLATARMGSGTPSASNYLRGDGSWQTVTAGVGGSTGATDNVILRSDGTGGAAVQDSALVIDDATTSTQNNVALRNNHSETNSAIVITGKGTGSLIWGPKPDGTAVGGNSRGSRAVDLQPTRDSAARVASGTNAFAIGHSNLASGTRSFAGGTNCTASAESSFAFGDGSTCSSPYGGIASGDGCSSSGAGASHAFGFSCASTGNYAFSCGFDNTASGSSGSFACGQHAVANRASLFAYASGRFAADGDAQTIRYVLRGTTTTNAEVELLADVRLTIASGRVMFMNVMIVGVANGGGTVATFQRQYAIKNIGGTTSQIYAPVTIGTDSAASTSIALSANDTNDAVKIAATGLAATTIRWVAYVSAVEVAHG